MDTLAESPGQSVDVLTSVVAEQDLDGYERTGTGERRTGTDDEDGTQAT